MTETEIAHELFHLQLNRQGFQRNFMLAAPPDVDTKTVQIAATTLSSMIEHRIFYPPMRRMGFDPFKKYGDDLIDHIKRDQAPPSANNHAELLAIDYAVVALTSNDELLTRRVELWYRKHGWTAELEKGKDLTLYIKKFDPNTPEKKKTALETCLRMTFNKDVDVQ